MPVEAVTDRRQLDRQLGVQEDAAWRGAWARTGTSSGCGLGRPSPPRCDRPRSPCPRWSYSDDVNGTLLVDRPGLGRRNASYSMSSPGWWAKNGDGLGKTSSAAPPPSATMLSALCSLKTPWRRLRPATPPDCPRCPRHTATVETGFFQQGLGDAHRLGASPGPLVGDDERTLACPLPSRPRATSLMAPGPY